MKGAGLESKDQLVAETCRSAIEETTAFLQKSADQVPSDQRIQNLIDNYLSNYHRDTPEAGCILPTLSSEISRAPEEVKQAFNEEMDGFFDFVSTLVSEDKKKSIAIVSLIFFRRNK